MAFITKETVKKIREDLKKAFPRKDGWKFSIRGGNSSMLRIAIVEGPVTFEVWDYDPYTSDENVPNSAMNAKMFDQKKTVTNVGVNQYHINTNFVDGPGKDALLKIVNDIVGKYHWDESDSQTDYFHCAFYMSLDIGKGYEGEYVNVSETEMA